MGALDTVTEVTIAAPAASEETAVMPSPSGVRAILSRWWVAFWVSSVCVVSGHLTIKAGLNALTGTASANSTLFGRVAQTLMQPEVVGGLLVYGIGTVCWMIAVSQKDISFLFPLSSVNYVLVVAASALLFGEVISTRRAAGVALIVVGMILLNRKSGKETA